MKVYIVILGLDFRVVVRSFVIGEFVEQVDHKSNGHCGKGLISSRMKYYSTSRRKEANVVPKLEFQVYVCSQLEAMHPFSIGIVRCKGRQWQIL
jgi:hypothetical protein